MKNLTAKFFSLLMLAMLLGGSAQASHDGYVNGSDCCRPQYECGCNPLYCGAWDLQIQAGVNPILWRHRGPVLAANCASSSTAPIVVLFDEQPRFSKLHKTPWIVGGQIGYAMSDNSRVFVEFDYSQAQRKNAVVVPATLASVSSFSWTLGKYKLFEGYVGARYYWDRWCDSLSFFLGGKVGFTHHKKQSATFLIQLTGFDPVNLANIDLVRNSTVVSGGGHIGLDYCICGNWSLVLTAEVVASCGPRHVPYFPLVANSNLPGFSAIFPGSVGTELRFPVTVAVRYSF